jgi:hypothetical protein
MPGGWQGSGGDERRTAGQGFRGSRNIGQWRVECFDEDGGCEVEVFIGFDARWQAVRYAADKYGVFDVI